MHLFAVFLFCDRSVVSGILKTVRSLLHFYLVSPLIFIPFNSQSRQVRHPLRISFRRVVSSLPSILPHGTPTLLAPLLTRPLLCYSPLLWNFRSGNEYFETESEITGCWYINYSGDLEFPTFRAVGLWDRVDETEV